MANLSCIPKFVKKEIVDIWVAEGLWRLMLLNSTHIPNPATQQFITDVSAKEIAPSGDYAAGGVVITGRVSKADPDNLNNYFLDFDDVIIGGNATLNYRYGVLYKSEVLAATAKIRATIDFLDQQIVNNGTSTIKWNTLGIIYIS